MGCLYTSIAYSPAKISKPILPKYRHNRIIKSGIEKEELPLVAIVTTGGTIAEKEDPKTGGAIPAVSGKNLKEITQFFKDHMR